MGDTDLTIDHDYTLEVVLLMLLLLLLYCINKSRKQCLWWSLNRLLHSGGSIDVENNKSYISPSSFFFFFFFCVCVFWSSQFMKKKKIYINLPLFPHLLEFTSSLFTFRLGCPKNYRFVFSSLCFAFCFCPLLFLLTSCWRLYKAPI